MCWSSVELPSGTTQVMVVRKKDTGDSDYRIGNTVRQVRIPENNSYVKAARLASESQESRANLEEGRT